MQSQGSFAARSGEDCGSRGHDGGLNASKECKIGLHCGRTRRTTLLPLPEPMRECLNPRSKCSACQPMQGIYFLAGSVSPEMCQKRCPKSVGTLKLPGLCIVRLELSSNKPGQLASQHWLACAFEKMRESHIRQTADTDRPRPMPSPGDEFMCASELQRLLWRSILSHR